MTSASVRIHPSQFPSQVRRDLLESLHRRCLNHKFLYDSQRQTQKWLALHETHSPARTDANCLETYDRSFTATAEKFAAKAVHVIGLGAGGGQKDTRLLELLRQPGRELFYTPCDVGVAMTLVARQTALSVVRTENCFPFVCDLATAENLDAELLTRHPSLVTFFGMIPNFEPDLILPRLAALVRSEDFLLFSANLAPGADYAAGMEKILPQYDNALTRDWLLSFLDEAGVERGDGELRFTIEDGAENLKRVVARFHFSREKEITVDDEKIKFDSGEALRLFFSYRYTPALVKKALSRHGLQVQEQWTTESQEEGVFLCRRER
jgi:uncharacterized SAM-dependent methyltransferase